MADPVGAASLTRGYAGQDPVALTHLQGVVDDVLSFFINLGLVVPVLPLMIVLAGYAPVKGIGLIIIVITVTGWAFGARLKRAQIITLRTRDYVTAAKFAGDGTTRIIFCEIAPNMTSLIVVGFMGSALGAIGAESGLAFSDWATLRRRARERCSTRPVSAARC